MSFKILLLVKSLGLGGAERLLVDSLLYLDRQQFEYHLAYMLPWKNLLVPHFVDADIPVHSLGTRNRATPNEAIWTSSRPSRLTLPLSIAALYQLHQRQRFDLIHADLPISGLAARMIRQMTGVPVLYTEHNLQARYHPLTAWSNRVTYGWNDHVFAVSEEVAASIRQAGMDRNTTVETLLNGIPVEQVNAEAVDLDALRQELQIPKEHTIVGTVAVFRKQKRLLDWVAVAAKIASTRQDVTFLLAGDGPEMASVRKQVDDLGLRERIRLPGFRADGRRLIGLMDIYLMTSEFEGLPIALLEAMALAKPVVATDVGGIPEAVTHAEEAYLTKVGQLDELARWVHHLLDDPQQRTVMGQAGRKRVDAAFHLKYRVQTIEARYAKILAGAAKEISELD
ncbi:glycosyltransferase [bacterium]|nr:glycosyltransferase [bacterium]